MRSSLLGSVLVLCLSGCGGGPTPSDVDPAQVDAFLAQVATRRCEGALACVADEVQRSQSLGTQAHCEAAVLGELANRAITITEAAVRGEIAFDASGSEACLDAIEAWACEERVSLPVTSFPWPPACAAVLSGTLAPGAACSIDEQCDGGHCDCGTCVAYAAEGASCAGAPCAPGLRCEAEVCVPALHLGDECTVEFPEEPAGDCPPNLLCVDGTCRAASDFRTAGEGEECYSPRDDEARVYCAEGLDCDFGRADEPGTCVAPLAEGEPCSGENSDLCADGLLCHGRSDDLRCRPYLEEGDECFPSGWGDPCGPGLVCGLGTSVCRRLSDMGEPCDTDYDCHSGYCGAEGCEASAFRFCS